MLRFYSGGSGGSGGGGQPTKRAMITASATESTINDNTLITAFDTVFEESSDSGITVSAGVITLPANTPGYKWRLCAGVFGAMTSAQSATLAFTENPGGSPPTPTGIVALHRTVNQSTAGYVNQHPIHYFEGAGDVGLMVVAVGGTATLSALGDNATAPNASYIEIYEVPTGAALAGVSVAAELTKWAVVTLDGTQAGVNDNELITGFDTVFYESASSGITVSAGVITLPANTAGYKWGLVAKVYGIGSAAQSFVVAFTENPEGSPPTPVGIRGFYSVQSETDNRGSQLQPEHYVSGAGDVGLMVVTVDASATVNIEGDSDATSPQTSYIRIFEVPA